MPILAPLAGIAIALFAVLLIYGFEQLGRVLAHIFPGSIGIGPFSINIRSWVQAGVDALASVVAWIIGDVIRPMINLVLAPVMQAINWFESLLSTIDSAASGFLWLINSGIPDLTRALVGDIATLGHNLTTLVGRVAADINATIARLDRDLVGLIGRVAASVQAATDYAYRQATAYAKSLSDIAIRDITTLSHDLTALIGRVETDVVRYAQSLAAATLTEAQRYATTAAAASVGVLSTDIDHAVDIVAPGLIEDLGSLSGVIATDFPDVGAIVRSIDITDVTSVAGSIAGTMAITDALVKLARDCTVPNCRNLSGLGRDLQALLDMVGDAAFLAFLIELITNPNAGAHTVIGLFGGIADDTISLTREMVGI